MPGLKISKADRVKIGPKFICTQCDLLLDEPMQTQCGHLLCNSCLQQILSSTNPVCPNDGTKLKKEQVFLDAFTNREVMGLQLECPNDGCHWIRSFKEIKDHLRCCDHALIQCVHVQCKKEIKRSLLAEHLEQECNYRLVTCTYCKEEMAIIAMKEHVQMSCLAAPLTCKFCGTAGIVRSEMTNHERMECEEVAVECEFKAIGCNYSKVGKRRKLRHHHSERQVYHMQLLVSFVMKMSVDVQTLASKIGNTAMLESAVQKLSTLGGAHSVTVNDLTEKFSAMLSVMKALEQRVGKLGPSGSSNGASGSKVLENEPSDMKKRLETLEDKNKKLENEIREKTATIERLNTKLEQTDHTVALNVVKLTEVETSRNQSPSIPVSHSGVLIWKIDDFNRKRQEAISGTMTAIYSPHFYSSQFGYKMCVRIYMNGDGFGKGTHISLFFVIMKGEYDALLPWPFQKKITMMILDQTNGDHMIDAFRSDPDSSSFQRPKNRLNIASGSPLFLPLETLNNRGYVKDDTMFVKIIVD